MFVGLRFIDLRFGRVNALSVPISAAGKQQRISTPIAHAAYCFIQQKPSKKHFTFHLAIKLTDDKKNKKYTKKLAAIFYNIEKLAVCLHTKSSE